MRAYNREGWLKGPAFPLEYRPAGASDKGNNGPAPVSPNTKNDPALEQIHLYALVVGTSTFRGTQLNLKYPDKDASAFADALRLAGAPLFGKNIEVKLLTTGAEPWPRKAEIARAFQEYRRRGRNPPTSCSCTSPGTASPTHRPAKKASSTTSPPTSWATNWTTLPPCKPRPSGQDTLMAWIRQVNARKRILILDACNSGRVVEVLEPGAKALNSDQRRALEQMKDPRGHVRHRRQRGR